MTSRNRFGLVLVLFTIPALFAVVVAQLWVALRDDPAAYFHSSDWNIVLVLLLLYIVAAYWYARTAKAWSWTILPFVLAQLLMIFTSFIMGFCCP
jgi:hypothetical protein